MPKRRHTPAGSAERPKASAYQSGGIESHRPIPEPAKRVEIAAVIVATLAAVASAAGVWISHGQLTEMRLQREDAENDALATRTRQRILDAQQVVAGAAADKRQSDLITANQDLAAAAQRQARATQAELNAQRLRFIEEERPRVQQWLEGEHLARDHPQVDPQGILYWNYNYRNIGRGDAIHVTTATYMRIGDGPFVGGAAPSEFALPPQQQYFGSVGYSGKLSKDQIQSVMANNTRVTMEVLFKYKDIYGNKYRYYICQFTQDNGVISHCNVDSNGRVSYE